jgi:hypothetical protein
VQTVQVTGPDSDWPLFARLALSGARIVSIPEPLAGHGAEPGRVEDVPGDGLVVLEAFEKAGRLDDLPQLAATLAAAYARASLQRQNSTTAPQGRWRRALERVRP